MADLQKFLPQADVAAEKIKAIVLELKEAFDNFDGDLGDATQRTSGWDMIQHHILQEENLWDDAPAKVSKAVIFYGDNWLNAPSTSDESDDAGGGRGKPSPEATTEEEDDEEESEVSSTAPPVKKFRLEDIDESDDDGLFEEMLGMNEPICALDDEED